jgi:WD40 repeat protein
MGVDAGMMHRVAVICWCLCLFVIPVRAEDARVVVQSGHTARVNALAVVGGRDLAATASNDFSVRLWRIKPPGEGTLLQVFVGHTGFVRDVAFNVNDETQLASCGDDGTVRLWTIGSSTSRTIYLEERPSRIAYRKNSNILAVASDRSPLVRFFDANTGKETDRPIETSANVTSIAFSDDGNTIICGLVDGSIEVYDARKKELTGFHRLSDRDVVAVFGLKGRVMGVTVDGVIGRTVRDDSVMLHRTGSIVDHARLGSTADTVFLVAGNDTITKVDVWTGKSTSTYVAAKRIDVLVQSADGSLLAYGQNIDDAYAWWIGEAGRTTLYPIETPAVIQNCIAINTDGSLLAAGDNNGNVTIFSLKHGGEPIRLTNLGLRSVHCLAFSLEAGVLIVGGFGPSFLTVVNTSTWDIDQAHKGDRSITSIESVGGTYIYVLDERTRQILMLDLASPTMLQYVVGGVTHMALSKNTDHLFAIDGGQIVHIDARLAKVRSRVPTPFKGTITSVDVFNNARSIVAGTIDGDLVVIDAESGDVMREMDRIHDAAITDILATSDMIVTSSEDAVIRLWDPVSLVPLEPGALRDHSGQVRDLAMDHDGRLLASCSNDGSIIVRRRDSITLSRSIVTMGVDWVVFDTDGQFDATVQGMERLKVVRGTQAYPIGGLASSRYHPMLITTLYDDVVQATTPIAALTSITPPPTIHIHPPVATGATEAAEIEIAATVDAREAGTYNVSYSENDKLIAVQSVNVGVGETIIKMKLPLVEGKNVLKATIKTADGREYSDTVTVDRIVPRPVPPRLFILSIGINKYRNPALDLEYARSDASAITTLLKDRRPKDLEVYVQELNDEEATIENVNAALFDIQQRSRPQDAFIFYFAGHGTIVHEATSSSYCLALHNVTDVNNVALTTRHGLMSDTLRAYLLRIPAQRQAVIIDACYSGAMMAAFSEEQNAVYMSSLQRSTGAIVLASVMPDARSKEVLSLKHGLFTYALMQGLEGKARDADGDVTVLGLISYIAKSMPAYCNQAGISVQQPVMRFEGAIRTMILATGS